MKTHPHVLLTGTRVALDTLVDDILDAFQSVGSVHTAKHFVHHDNADYDPVEFREFLDVAEFGAPPGRAGRNPLPIVVMDLVPTCAEGVHLLGRAATIPGVALWITWESDVPEHLVDAFEVIDADVVLAKRGAHHG